MSGDSKIARCIVYMHAVNLELHFAVLWGWEGLSNTSSAFESSRLFVGVCFVFSLVFPVFLIEPFAGSFMIEAFT